MIKELKEEIVENERAFFATLTALATIIINLYYYISYDKDPLNLVSLIPIILWIAYDGHEHEKESVEGYWLWVLALVISTVLVIVYPLF